MGKPGKARKKGFVYSLTDLQTLRVLWRRKQLESEGFCSALHVSDSAWTVILTDSNELVIVNPRGEDAGMIDLKKDAFTADELMYHNIERERWTRASLWYFYPDPANKRELFVARLWWGKRIVVDVYNAKLVDENDKIVAALNERDKAYVLWVLDSGVKTRRNWEKKKGSKMAWLVFDASFLAGKMGLKEAVPLLANLQSVDLISSGHFSDELIESDGRKRYKPVKGRINPYYWKVFGIRQAAQLSLRRLGEQPGPYDCTQFCRYKGRFETGRPYECPPLRMSREEQMKNIKLKQKPEEVLDLLRAPDYVDGGDWYYEMNAKEPFTLRIKWDRQGVSDIMKISPALWTREMGDRKVLY